MSYTITWITEQLAAGSAPMSYEDLDVVKQQGIDAIVNLCGEFCDLHQIEERSGFEVYYLPIPDDCAPDMQLMEKALQWLDEALYLKKKVLIHCRYGLGRTGTFVSAYLLRRGFGLKLTEKKLKPARITPSSYSQWQLLRKYGKEKGRLKARAPRIEGEDTVDLLPFLREQAAILQEAEVLCQAAGIDLMALATDTYCHRYFELELIEAVCISHTINRQLSREQRLAAMERAAASTALIKNVQTESGNQEEAARILSVGQTLSCPLLVGGVCILHASRPLRCRSGLDLTVQTRLQDAIRKSSRGVFLALTGTFSPAAGLRFSIFDTVSGRFVQKYFQAMLKKT